jgi:hypothetical protein
VEDRKRSNKREAGELRIERDLKEFIIKKTETEMDRNK